MYPLTYDPLDGFSVLFGDDYVSLGGANYSTGKFVVDVLNLTNRDIDAIRQSVARSRNRIGKCAADGSRDGLMDTLRQITYLKEQIPVFRELVAADAPQVNVTAGELGAVFEETSEEHDTLIEWLRKLEALPGSIVHFKERVTELADNYLAGLKVRTPSAYAAAWGDYQLRLSLESQAVYDELSDLEGDELRRTRKWQREEVKRRSLPTIFAIHTTYEAVPHPKKVGEYLLAERVQCDDLETFLMLDLLRGFAAGHIPRRCDHCGHFFLLDSGYNIRYCENEAPDVSGKTCSQVGAHSKEQRRSKENPVIAEYKRVYNRLKTRKNRGQLSQDNWNRQVAEIQDLRDASLKGEITLTMLRAWFSMY